MSGSDNLKRKADTSYHGPGSEKRSKATVKKSIQENLKHNLLVAEKWEQIVTAIFDRGDQSPLYPRLTFPRSTLHRVSRPAIKYEELPQWHKDIVQSVLDSDVWKDMQEAFPAATCEADLYAPLRDTLNAISTAVRTAAPYDAAWDVARLSWINLPQKPVEQIEESESPTMSFDLAGAIGWNADSVHNQPYYGQEDTFTNAIQLLDVLAVIEVGFTKITKQASGARLTDQSSTQTPTLPLSSEFAAPFITPLPLGAAYFNGPQLRGGHSSSSMSSAPMPSNDSPYDTPAEASRLPSTHTQRKGELLHTPVNKLLQIIGYLASVREAQLFRTSGIGLLIQNSQFTLVHSDPAGTVISPNMDIFSDPEAFISIIIFLTMADFPAWGWDPLWVNPTRSLPSSDHRFINDPRHNKGRIVHFQQAPYMLEGVGYRAFCIQGRGTTVMSMRTLTPEDAELYREKVGRGINDVVPILAPDVKDWFLDKIHSIDRVAWKTSCQARNRKLEWNFNIRGSAHNIPEILAFEAQPFAIWSNRALAGLPIFEPCDQRTMISVPYCTPLGASKTEYELITAFLQAILR